MSLSMYISSFVYMFLQVLSLVNSIGSRPLVGSRLVVILPIYHDINLLLKICYYSYFDKERFL